MVCYILLRGEGWVQSLDSHGLKERRSTGGKKWISPRICLKKTLKLPISLPPLRIPTPHQSMKLRKNSFVCMLLYRINVKIYNLPNHTFFVIFLKSNGGEKMMGFTLVSIKKATKSTCIGSLPCCTIQSIISDDKFSI